MSHSVRVLAKLIAWVIGIRRILCQGGVDQWQRRESWIHRQQQQQQPSVNNIGAWIWMICISMMEDPAGHPGGREPKKEKKNGHHPSRREKKEKREDGPQPPLEVGFKMECAGPKVDQRPPPPLPNGGGHLSLDSHSLEFFPVFFRRASWLWKKLFPPPLSVLWEMITLRVLFFFFWLGSHDDNNQPRQTFKTIDLLACVPLLAKI